MYLHYPSGHVVYRGIKDDISADYLDGREFVWYQITSTTTNMNKTLEFMDVSSSGVIGTLFVIELTQGIILYTNASELIETIESIESVLVAY